MMKMLLMLMLFYGALPVVVVGKAERLLPLRRRHHLHLGRMGMR